MLRWRSTLLFFSYFGHSKLGSFQAHLRSYGFQQTSSGKDNNVYSHEHFVRGNPDLLQKIKPKRAFTVEKQTLAGLTHSIAASFVQENRMAASKANSSSPRQETAREQEKCPPTHAEEHPESPKSAVPSSDDLQIKRNTDAQVTSDQRPESSKPLSAINIIKDQGQSNCISPLETHFAPLQVPGRLRPQPATAPTALRFVPLPYLPSHGESEADKWVKPIILKPISLELDGSNWGEMNASPKSKSKCAGERQFSE
jgi:HSF-type DNA-binding